MAPLYVASKNPIRIVAGFRVNVAGWDDSREFAEVRALAGQGRFREALPRARRALGAAAANRVPWLMLAAWLERNTGDLTEAGRHLAEALTLCGGHGDYRRAVVQAQMADLLRQRGDFTGSDRLWRELALLPEAARLPQTLEGRGMALAELGEWQEAEQCLTDAVTGWTLALSGPDPSSAHGTAMDLLQARYNLAALYVRLGFFNKAEPILRDITTGSGVPPHHPALIRPLAALACLTARGAHEPAPGTRELLRGLLEEASLGMESTQGKESPAAAEILMALAALDFSEGRLAESADHYQFALMIRLQKLGGDHPATLTTLRDQGALFLAQGEIGQARQKFATAAAGFARRLGALHPATAGALEKSALCAALLDRRGEALEQAVRLADAHASQRECLLSFASSSEIAGFYRDGMPWDLPCLLGDAPLALRSALLFKGTADEEMTRQRYLRTRALKDPATRQLLLQLQSARSRLRQQTLQETTASEDSLRSARMDVGEAERAMARTVHAHRAAPYGKDLTLEALRRAVGPSCALVEYLKYRKRTASQPLGQEHYAAAVLLGGSGQTGFFPLGPCAESDEAVARFHEKVRSPGTPVSEVEEAAHTLHRGLWQPLAGFLNDVREVAVCPEGQLNFVPFAALPDQSGEFVSKLRTVRIIASSRDLLDSGSVAVSGAGTSPTALLIGNPFFNDSRALARNESGQRGAEETDPAMPPQLGHLKQAEAEARALQDSLKWGGWQSVLLADQEATEEKLTDLLTAAPPPRLLHFATHGLFQDQRTGGPADVLARGGLALAGAQTTLNQWFLNHTLPADRDGILLSDEVAALDLHGTELAVLSACRTGAGEALDAEGVMGLRRAFAVAGARSMLVTLWVVEDGGTRELMHAFYEAWLEGRSVPDALRMAQGAALTRLAASPQLGVGGAIRAAGAFMAITRGPLRVSLPEK